jgi:hypothetical protein
VELTDKLSIQKAIAMRLPYEPPAPEKPGKGVSFTRMLARDKAPAAPVSG